MSPGIPATPAPNEHWSRKRSIKLGIDVSLFAGFVAAIITHEGPNFAVHSWIGLAIVPAVAIHLKGSASWIKRVWAAKRGDREFGLGCAQPRAGRCRCSLLGYRRSALA